MVVPEMTDEQRAAGLVKAAAARRARVQFKDRLKRGETTLAQLLHDAATDDVIGKTRISEVLMALPKVGKATARELMTELQIAPTRRVRGLSDRQRQALLHKFGVHPDS